jgi:hypothetical protein
MGRTSSPPARRADRVLGRHPLVGRLVLQVLDQVAVGAHRELGAVPELTGDVDDRPALVQQQRRERVAQVVGACSFDAGRVERAAEPSAAPLVEPLGCPLAAEVAERQPPPAKLLGSL